MQRRTWIGRWLVVGVLLVSVWGIMAWGLSAQAAPHAAPSACSGLFFSEYIEGSSNNKALEIYNGSGVAVDMADYTVKMYFNGSGSAGVTIDLAGTVAAGDVFVLAHADADPSILAQADQTDSSGWYNGDDAVALEQGGVPIDVIGQIGLDPGTEWGSGDASTANNTLRRKSTVSQGDTNGGDAFTPADQWDGYPQDTFDGLGSHVADCSGGDMPPRVSSTTPANAATGVATTTNIVIQFSEPVTVTATWYAITCTVTGGHAAAVSGGPQSYTLDPATDFDDDEVCTVAVYASQVTDQDGDPHLMLEDYIWSFSTGSPPAPCSTIPLIQGSDYNSPCENQTVSNIEACITGVAAAGFYMQDVSGDGNPATSDGIYVYRGSWWTNPAGWEAGDLVRVSGKIIEYYNMTEFQYGNSVSVIGSCTVPASVAVAPISDPNADPMALYESYEGMRVHMSFGGWVTGPTKRFLSRFAVNDPEIVFVDFSSTIPRDSRVFEEDYTGYQGLNYLNGGLNIDLPDLDFGDYITGSAVSGVLGYQFDKYTLLVDAAPALTIVDRPDVTSNVIAADPAKREFDVCFYNVENLFDHIDDGQGDWGDWAPGYPTSGSPAGLLAYQEHLTDTAQAIIAGAQSCMVIGVEEMEGKQQVYDDLAAALHLHNPSHTWTAGYVESGDTRDISQGFLWRDDVTLMGSLTPVSGSPYTEWVADGVLDFVRVPPTAKFRFFGATSNPLDIQTYAFHFKSKRASSSCSTPDCTDKRELEAADLRDILAHHATAGEYAIAGGDFNDYLDSSPINILKASAAAYTPYYDLPARARYSYIFNGESEALDYLFFTASLSPTGPAQLARSFSLAHVNADFSSVEHASDHDPLHIRFSGSDRSNLPPVYGQAWHTGPHTVYLGASVDNDIDSSADENDGVLRGPGSGPHGQWADGNSGSVTVTVSGGCLNGWVDWNQDGDFEDALERIITDTSDSGVHNYGFPIPAGTFGGGGAPVLNARFRLYTVCPGTALPAGDADDGEVEDYTWSFTPTAVTLQSFGSLGASQWLAPALALALGLLGLARVAQRRRR